MRRGISLYTEPLNSSTTHFYWWAARVSILASWDWKELSDGCVALQKYEA